MAAPRKTPRWMLRESARAGVVMTASVAVTFITVTILRSTRVIETAETTWLAMLVGWALFAGFHTLATWLAFRGRGGAELRAALDVENEVRAGRRGIQRTGWYRAIFASENGPSWAAQLALMALIGVGSCC